MLASSGERPVIRASEGCTGPPTLHPDNADVRDLPKHQGRTAIFRIFGNALYVDAGARGPRAEHDALAALGAALEHWAGGVADEPRFRALTARADDPSSATERFAAWFARAHGGPDTQERLRTDRPGVAAYFDEFEARIDTVDRALQRMAGPRAGRWHVLAASER